MFHVVNEELLYRDVCNKVIIYYNYNGIFERGLLINVSFVLLFTTEMIILLLKGIYLGERQFLQDLLYVDFPRRLVTNENGGLNK